MIPENFQLRNASRTVKLFLTAFLAVLSFGYAFGLVFVHHTTSMSPEGVLEQYRGNGPDNLTRGELKYEKTVDEMLTFTHNHVLSLTILFFIVGGILLFSSSPPDPWKRLLIIEPFVAILTTFGGLWLMRFSSGWFVWLVILSGVSMVLCYLAAVYIILRELWFLKS